MSDDKNLKKDPGEKYQEDFLSADGSVINRRYVDSNLLSHDLRKRVDAAIRTKVRHMTGFNKKIKLQQSGLRIGYSFWGFLGDHKMSDEGDRLSTPDGNATYSWSFILEAVRRGHRVIPMMPDRDKPACDEYGVANFESIAQAHRVTVYTHLVESTDVFHGNGNSENDKFPELDVLVLEWRFPIKGRNFGLLPVDPGYQPDFDRQTALLKHYSDKKTKIIIWDLDLKLTEEDEKTWPISSIIETSVHPIQQVHKRVQVEPPVYIDSLMEWPTVLATNMLSYIGSRYERDDVIDHWIRPIANREGCRGKIHFYGNWMKDLSELTLRWPGVCFNDRVTLSEFKEILRCAAGVPLLAKEEYRKRGFITPRVWEALAFGSIPVGLHGHAAISKYTDFVAKDPDNLKEISLELLSMSLEDRDKERKKAIDKIKFMDVKYFMNTLEGLF